MDGATHTTSGTEVPSHQSNAFPPFDTTTYSAQLFWLTITFVLLLLVMWRLGVRRIGGNIDARKGRISGDLTAAERHRENADKASADYEAALTAARNRAHGLAEGNRKRLMEEVEKAKAEAETQAQGELAKAEERIAAVREQSKAHVRNAARDAAIAIVARLTGDTVPPDEAAGAVGER
jgi:F-type H+-transporting ATPase subunit b